MARMGSIRSLTWAAMAGAWLMGAPLAAGAAEFRSVGAGVAVLYDSPSTKGRKLSIAPRGMPLEVVSSLPNWVKVRDMLGDVMWIEGKDLSARRTLIASTLATLRASAQDTAPIVVQVERGVLLEPVEGAAAAGWVRVRHAEGASGFVKAGEVWGR